jgi:hypothetical protein
MKTLLMILVFTAFAACNNDDENMNGFNLENQIYLSFKNSKGLNLLDASTENSFNRNSIRLYYLIANEPVEVTIENGYNMGSTELTSDKLLKVFTNPSSSNIIEKTSDYDVVENIAYLKLSETDTDTIKTYSKSSQKFFIVSKVWYNDQLVWERESGGVIGITKE